MFNIEAKPATQSLTDYARQAHTQLGYDVDVVDEILTNAVVGEYGSAEALQLLLEGTGLEAEHGERGIFIRREPKREVGGDIEERTPPVAQTNSLRFVQVLGAEVHATAGQNQTSGRTGTGRDEREAKRPLEEIIVTGTNIRGIASDSSPTRTFTRESVQMSGAATTQDFIQTLTANFGGGSNANIPSGLPNDNSGGSNAGSFGSFGSSVNLHGLGSGSTLVLLNGNRVAPASFNGDFTDISMIPASAIERIETLSDGASSIYGSDAVAGVVNFVLRDDFDGFETSLRYGMGTQHGTPDQYRANATAGNNWSSGHALIAYEFFTQEQLSVEDRKFAPKDILPNYLLPSQERHSVLISATQDVTSNFVLSADSTYSNREARQLRTDVFGGLTQQFDASSENLNISAGGVWNVSTDWFFDFSGTYSKIDTRNRTSIGLNRLRVIDSDMWTADAKLSGSLFHLPGGDVKLAFGGHFRMESFLAAERIADAVERKATRDVYALFGEAFIPIVGPENRLPGVNRLELNASGRFSDYSDFGSTADPKVGLLWSPFNGLKLRGTYSTSFKAPVLGRVGENSFGAVIASTAFTNGLFGLTAADPSIADVPALHLSGTADNLDPETSRAITAGLDLSQQWGQHNLALSTTWFDIDFEGRLGNVPLPGSVVFFDAVNLAFDDPGIFPEGTVVFSPSPDEINDVLASLDIFNNPFGIDPAETEIINGVVVVRNLSRTVVRGFDLNLSYAYGLNDGSLQLGLDVTSLQDFKQQATSTTPVVDHVNTLFNPVDLKLRGHAGYADSNFSANIFLNYVDNYSVSSTPGSEPIGSWATVDVSLAYGTKEDRGKSFLSNADFRLSAINIFDEDPPRAPNNPNLRVDGFDPTNASPLGRFVAFEISKRW